MVRRRGKHAQQGRQSHQEQQGDRRTQGQFGPLRCGVGRGSLRWIEGALAMAEARLRTRTSA
jgi:hypothetical protein